MSVTRPTRLRFVCLWLALGGVCLVSGCGYAVGHAFDPEIRTVYVPIFTNQTNRRNIEYQLTEAVQKQIQTRSPFTLVHQDEADTRLTGAIVDVRKNVLGETRNDDPRELQFGFAVKVKWEDLRNQRIISERTYPISEDSIQFLSNASFAPEVGQSLATATQQSVDKMARDIVNMMETTAW